MNDRDYFAAAAIGALISLESDADVRGLANDAYLYADAMLAKRDEMQPTGSPITLTDEEREEIISTVAGAWSLMSHMRNPLHSAIAETLDVVNSIASTPGLRQGANCAVGLNAMPAPVGASSTAVDDHWMPDREIAVLSADACLDIRTPPLPDTHSVTCRLQRFARDAIRLDRYRRDAVPRFTAEEVAWRLVRVEPDAVGQRAIVYVGSIGLSVEDDIADAERRAVACRTNIRRTLEARP